MLTYIPEFKQSLTLRGLAPSTINEMARDISLIDSFLFPLKLHLLEQAHLEDSLLSLKQSHNLKNVSLNRKITSLKCFFTFLYNKGCLSFNPAENIPFARRIKNTHPTYLIKAEMQGLLSCSSCNHFHNTIIHTLYELGLRSSELVNLQITDVDSVKMQIRVFGKGCKVRYVPFGQALLSKFREIIKTSNGFRTKGHLFVMPSGSPLTSSYLQNLIRHYSAMAGIQKSATPKTLRHTHATHSLEAGVDLFSVKKNLGHSDLSSTLVYYDKQNIMEGKWRRSYIYRRDNRHLPSFSLHN